MNVFSLLRFCVTTYLLHRTSPFLQRHLYSIKIKNTTLYSKKTNNHNSFLPKTANQELYLKYLRNPSIKILFSIGPAGTGKTFLACNEAITLLKYELISKIILTRPVVPVEEDIGFLPGTLVKKMDPWTRPILDIFEEKFSKQEIENLIKTNVIEISPLAYMRGRTFKNAYIIADEMQNSSPNQMLMLTTRIGENSKMIITGDLKQTDKPFKSGLSDFISRYYRFRDKYVYETPNVTMNNYTESFIKDVGIQIIEFDNKDIQRSQVVNKILDIYENYDNLQNVQNVQNLDYHLKYIKYDLIKEQTNINQNITEKDNKTYSYINNDAALIPKSIYK
jgi:phosphate starvation-inducible PhoH-like protein